MQKDSLYSNDFPYLSETEYFDFPNAKLANPDGILAIGGNLSPGMLLSAYKQGIFPWYSEHEPILWWSPDPRFVLIPKNFHISKSMKKIMKKISENTLFKITVDKDFKAVISECGKAYRKDQKGTWITKDMINAYCELHELGFAHSVEVWQDGRLVGGLYGISIGNCFCGESMFTKVPNASKAGFIALTNVLQKKGYSFIDCQVATPHLKSLGATEIPRKKFLKLLENSLLEKTIKGNWGNIFKEF